jgi:hypothetical protein
MATISESQRRAREWKKFRLASIGITAVGYDLGAEGRGFAKALESCVVDCVVTGSSLPESLGISWYQLVSVQVFRPRPNLRKHWDFGVALSSSISLGLISAFEFGTRRPGVRIPSPRPKPFHSIS